MAAPKGNQYAIGNPGGGRPTKFKEEYIELAYNYALLGAIDKDLARMFDVSETTINAWKKEHEEFSEALKKGKYEADAQVARSLFKRAMGYTYKELKEEESEHGIKNTVTTKEVAPDTTAQIFWLKNRQPAMWRDKQEIDNTSSDGSMSPARTVRELSDEELERIASESE